MQDRFTGLSGTDTEVVQRLDDHWRQHVSVCVSQNSYRQTHKCCTRYVTVHLSMVIFRIHPNLRSTVYCNAIAAGGAAEWNFAWEQFKNMTIATEAEKIRAALACTKEPWLLNRSAHR